MKRQFLGICLLVFLITFPFAAAGLAQEENIQGKANDFINNYNNQDFRGVTKLFHFPRDYTANELKEDKDAISKVLKLYYEEFGKITNIKKNENPSNYYNVSIGSGNIPYWQKYPETVNLSYKVKFSREGLGYIDVVFCHISEKWEIRKVSYGLPADRPKSQERIVSISQKIMKLLRP